ncbi:MAG: outer membrane lipoprotein-sorting protein [Acidobacteria bacterium]|nr:outer membrane lipoprotein-sorting protein [Acidobacteriota bacterium]
MRTFSLFSTLFLAGALALPGAVSVDQLLANMDKAAAAWKGMRAETSWTQYTKLVDDSSVESGTVVVRRVADGRVDFKVQFTEPYPRDLLVRGTQVEIYKPRIATVEEYDVSKSKDKLEQALLSGFGVSGKFLREHYEIAMQGEEAVEGVNAVKVELVPKDQGMRESIAKVVIWVSPETWQPVQQRLYQPNGDHRTYLYTKVEINPGLKDADFKLDIPKKVKRQKKDL